MNGMVLGEFVIFSERKDLCIGTEDGIAECGLRI